MKPLKIVFLGTPDFAVASLKAIHESEHEVVGVVTMPDKKMGRGRKLQGSAVKKYASDQGLFIMQPEKLKNPDFVNELQSLQADLFVVVAFRMLPEIVWNMPEHGTLNVHGSLLPQYRGAAPINWAIINGEKETGVTVFRLKHEIDTGDILLRKSIPILEDDNAESVHDKLMAIGAEAIVEGVHKIAVGDSNFLPQLQSSDLKSAPKIFKYTCKINWDQDIEHIHNFIRGLSPYPAAWSEIQMADKILNIKIYKTHIEADNTVIPGTVFTDGKSTLKIAGKNGWVIIDEIQIAGKKRMATGDLLRGYQLDHAEIIL
ncbi:methionyl-tRNA formyltransferase [bacterium SCSIO 12643]|nr:methionyl-tRNA formyltransferase [bacterium SCSIO 12643]